MTLCADILPLSLILACLFLAELYKTVLTTHFDLANCLTEIEKGSNAIEWKSHRFMQAGEIFVLRHLPKCEDCDSAETEFNE